MRINDEALYFTDNGAVYCGEHLGCTARMTGHDISGQPITRVTPDDLAEYERETARLGYTGNGLKCEQPGCDRRPSRLHTV